MDKSHKTATIRQHSISKCVIFLPLRASQELRKRLDERLRQNELLLEQSQALEHEVPFSTTSRVTYLSVL